jgi:uncharacterized repeat protein (TIGR01451 family)
MASILHTKSMSVVFRVIVVLAVLLSAFGFMVQPASAVASITQFREPGPPDYVLNTSGAFEYIWWKITYSNSLTPNHMAWALFGPAPDPAHPELNAGPLLQGPTDTALPTALAPVSDGLGHLSVYNAENTIGEAVNGTDQDYAHQVSITTSFKPGIYTSRVSFFSGSGAGTFDSSADITFDVRQPMLIFKYNDLNGDGGYDPSDSPPEYGLDGWVFTVTGPAGQYWSYTGFVADSPTPTATTFGGDQLTSRFPTSGTALYVNDVNVGAYTLVSGVFHVTMGAPPAAGQFISTEPVSTFTSDTAGGGFLDLPNGILVAGDYTIVETMQTNWHNTDPGAAGDPKPPHTLLQKTINVPDDVANPATFRAIFGNQENPGINLLKKTNGTNNDTAPGLHIDNVGDPITWTYEVTNTSDVPLHNIVVTDNMGVTPVYQSGDDGDGWLENGEMWIYRATGTAIDGYYANIGTVTGEPAVGDTVTDTNPDHYYTQPPVKTPASSNLSLWLMVGGLAGAIAWFMFRKSRRFTAK